MGKVIGVGGEKGGAGKTTLATNIAALAAQRGLRVGLLDSDAEKPDAYGWHLRRSQLAVLPQLMCKRAGGDIDDAIIAMREATDLLVIDTAGIDSPELRYAVAYADVFFAPFNPSRFDWDTCQKVGSIVALARPFNPGLRAHSVLAGVSNHRNSRSTQRARAALSKSSVLPCLDAAMHMLEVWRDCADSGRGVCDTEVAKARADIEAITDEAKIW